MNEDIISYGTLEIFPAKVVDRKHTEKDSWRGTFCCSEKDEIPTLKSLTIQSHSEMMMNCKQKYTVEPFFGWK